MKCQNCGGEMEKGTLSDNGNIWLKPGFRAKILKATYLGLANPYVYAWKCSNCGKIELYAEKNLKLYLIFTIQPFCNLVLFIS